MRNLIRRIEELNLTWFLTDIWKCYLLNNKENKEVSFNFCRDYLIREIEILNPKIVILFGGEVKKRFNELARGVKNKNYKVILSLFPSSRTSDRWVGKETKKEKGQFWEDGIIKKIKENMGGVVRGDETN